MPEQPSLRTPAWLLTGLYGNRPGVLELAEGRLAFTTDQGRAFEAPLAEVSDLKFPWYYFGNGMKLRVGGVKYRLSFVRPSEGQPMGFWTPGRMIAELRSGRRATKAWREVLTAPAVR